MPPEAIIALPVGWLVGLIVFGIVIVPRPHLRESNPKGGDDDR